MSRGAARARATVWGIVRASSVSSHDPKNRIGEGKEVEEVGTGKRSGRKEGQIDKKGERKKEKVIGLTDREDDFITARPLANFPISRASRHRSREFFFENNWRTGRRVTD